ncbi:MAG: twin-arginine translocase subunit TatB [Rhodospirillales bacterium]|nr:twin-arginine translocase subunit TatB [Rhodospirillales bacterium]
MLDLSWGEIVLIGTVAVVFIGPKELPGALRTMGKFVGKARNMAREFQSNVDDMIREAELEEVKNKVQSAAGLASGGIAGAIQNAIDPKGELEKTKGEIEKAMSAPETLAPPALADQTPAPQSAVAEAAPAAVPAEPSTKST